MYIISYVFFLMHNSNPSQQLVSQPIEFPHFVEIWYSLVISDTIGHVTNAQLVTRFFLA